MKKIKILFCTGLLMLLCCFVSKGQVVVNPTYRGMTYDELIAPLQAMQQAYDKVDNELMELAIYITTILSQNIDDELRKGLNAQYNSLVGTSDYLHKTGNIRQTEANYYSIRKNVMQLVVDYNNRVARNNGR